MINDVQKWNIKKNGSMICSILDWYFLKNTELKKPIEMISLDHLQKLCYICDFDRFEDTNERSITGEIYVHGDNGPVPIHFEETIKKLISFEKVRLSDSGHLSITDHPISRLLESDSSLYGTILSKAEEQSIEDTMESFGLESEEEIEKAVKDDTPWLLAGYCQALDYGYANYRSEKIGFMKEDYNGDNDSQ